MKHYYRYTTGYTKDNKLVTEETGTFSPDLKNEENYLISLFPSQTDQVWEGFGGAITDAAGATYAKMTEAQKKTLIETYFSPDNMGYTHVRIPMDSCDFSEETYEAAPDGDLSKFTMERAGKYILPMLADAQKAAGGPLKLMLSPWSPPAIYKTNGIRTNGGTLKPEHRADWAAYLCQYIKTFRDLGYIVERISLQNEPNATQTWDSCRYTAEEERAFLLDYMVPALKENGLSDVEVFIWDHNKERLFERAGTLWEGEGRAASAGAAFHWYSGDHFEQVALTHRLYPEKKLILSESCLEYCKGDAKNPTENLLRLAHEIIGDMKSGMNAFYDWNILLNEQGGPNTVGNFCHAPFLYHRETKELMPQSLAQCFYHFSHFLKSGCRRIETSSFSKNIESVAFLQETGEIVLIALHLGKEPVSIHLRLGETIASTTLPGESLTTFVLSDGKEPLC